MPSSPAPSPPSEVVEALLRLARTLDGAGVEYALIGAIAGAAWGLSRPTRDIDACVAIHPAHSDRIRSLLDALAGAGFTVEREAVRRRLDRGVRIVTVHRGRVRVDLFLRRPDGYWDSALAHRVIREAFGARLSFAAAEDVIALKLASDRARDREDAEALAAANRGALQADRLRAAVTALERAGRTGLLAAAERLLRGG